MPLFSFLFQIVMSKDNREDIISMTLEHGAAHYMVKPFCPEDFRDIWKYAVEGKKNRLFIDSLFAESEEEETKNKCSKRKSFGDHQDEGEFGVVKKPRLVWTNNLHSRFLNAIRQIGLGDVVPKKILEIMNVPNLTRENVASHLQKHRMFLKSVQEKGMEGGVSQRALNSKFASDLPISVVNEIAERRKNRRYSNLSVFQAKNSFNDGASTSNSSNPSLFQAKNSLKDGASTSNSSNLSLFQANNSFNDGTSTGYPSYGGRKGTMAASFLSSSFLTRNLKFGDTSYRNQSIVGKDSFNHFNYGGKNWSVGSTSKSNILPNVTFSSIKIRSTEVGTGTTNKGKFDNVIPYSFGFNFTGRNENTNFRPWLNEKSGLVHGGFGLELVSEANGVNASEADKSKAAVENEEHHKNANSINEVCKQYRNIWYIDTHVMCAHHKLFLMLLTYFLS
ncbi:putative transcription factor MYB-HB-like family [Medicago truncatula]|uniref:Putative transcription factor MYB-HB-like family n=1 Tax=Medicago truncatula TaxID=3880 RepID=A0A396HLS9_MEDTR|nr:putative transcription factor MYB-HB-like family [Medicago truncatula]